MEIWRFSKKIVKKVSASHLPKEGFLWIDAINNEILEVIQMTQDITGHSIDESHIDDCLNLNHPSFYDSTQAYDILIFRSLLLKQDYRITATAPISFILFRNLLVSFSHHDQAIHRVKKRLETQKRIPQDVFALAFLLLDETVDNFLELRSNLIHTYNNWQQKLFSPTKQEFNWLNFLRFKTDIRQLRIISEDQLEVIYQWRQDNEIGLSEYIAIRYNDLADHIKRIIRYTTQLEADLDTLIQLHYSLIGNRTNNVVKILTVLSAIFLPLNLVAGIFGMNFVNMRLLQIPHGEYIALTGMAVLGISLYLLFKIKKWI